VPHLLAASLFVHPPEGSPSRRCPGLDQEFFARLLANDRLEQVNPQRGKFRSFLLASVNHLLSDERDRATRQKRGGGQVVLSFDAQTAEERYRLEVVSEVAPERLFDRRWALALVQAVVRRLDRNVPAPARENSLPP